MSCDLVAAAAAAAAVVVVVVACLALVKLFDAIIARFAFVTVFGMFGLLLIRLVFVVIFGPLFDFLAWLGTVGCVLALLLALLWMMLLVELTPWQRFCVSGGVSESLRCSSCPAGA